MAHLRIQEPDQPERLIDLGDQPLTIGRDDGPGSTFIAEKRASRQHVRLTPGGGAFVVEDLGSSNGTWVGDQRIQRKKLQEGDQFRIGDTTFSLVPGAAPSSKPLVTGTLEFVRVDGLIRRPRVPEVPAEVEPEPPAFRPERRARRPTRYRDPRKAMVRAAVLFGVGAAALAAVELGLKPSVDKDRQRADAHREALTVLESAADGADKLREKIDDFRDAYPSAPELTRLNEHLDKQQIRDDAVARARGRLQIIAGRVGDMPVSELHFELLSLQSTLPDDEALESQLASLMAGLERRRVERDAEQLQGVTDRVTAALDAGDLPRALMTLDAFATANPFASETVRAGLGTLREKADKAMAAVVADATKRAAATKDRLARAEILATASRTLIGLPEGGQFAQQLKLWLRASPRPDAPSSGGPTPGQPTRPRVDPALLAQAKDAEALWQRRRWAQAAGAFDALLQKAPAEGPFKQEWTTRRDESRQMLSLVDALKRSLPEKGLRKKLSIGGVTVVDAKPGGVVWRKKRGDDPELVQWGNMPDGDALTVLTPVRMTPELRLAVGVLAGTVGNRAAFLDAIGGLFTTKSTDELTAAANRVVARHLYGRTEVPEGGYRAHKGELLDEAGYQAALRREQLDALRATCEKLLASLAKESAYKKLAKVAQLRDEIDAQRRYALQAIFNEKHYPYPYGNRGSAPYRYVAAEVAQRIAKVRETWASSTKARVKRSGRLGKSLDELEQALVTLKRMKAPDVKQWQKKADRFLIYATGETFTIQTYFRDAKERDLFQYDEWVRTQYNPARTEYAKGEERLQVQITNDYRRMMCYSAVVKPSDAAYQAIDEESCKTIMDAGKVVKLTPLRAVRIDNRLVRAARDHSIDMTRRSYFSHHSKPDPATGRGSTAPHDRMQTAGYKGWGYSENIAINTSALNAHQAWCTSSGHHRNILSPWQDLGVGHNSKRWTQNFGSGGGARPKVYDTTEIRAPDKYGGR